MVGNKREKESNGMDKAEHQEMKTLLGFTYLTLLLLLGSLTTQTLETNETAPVPTPWPEQFHALLYMNLTSNGHLQITDLWYDWPKGRNVNIMQKQLGELLYDVEWNNGTSFYYTLSDGDGDGAAGVYCKVMEFEVGIPRPDFMDGATYLGTEYTDGFLCNVWEKVDFIWYYEDVATKTPVRWDFYDGITSHVMTYEVGATLEDSIVQAPSYCFTQDEDGQTKTDSGSRKFNMRNSLSI